MKPFFFCLLFLTVAFPAANGQTAPGQMASGDHDDTIRRAVRRLSGKRQRTKHIKALEAALAAANERDMARIKRLEKRDDLAALEEVYRTCQSVQVRQGRIRPLLPLVGDEGYRPNIQLLSVAGMIEESHHKLTDHLLQKIHLDLQAAAGGKKLRARGAFDDLGKLKRQYGWDTPEFEVLRDSALRLGRFHVFVEVKNSAIFHGDEIMDRIVWKGWAGAGHWQVVHLQKMEGVEYDFTAKLEITDADVSREEKQEEKIEATAQVEVRNEVEIDSFGNEIDVPYFEEVTAEVTDIIMGKSAKAEAHLRIFGADGRVLLNEWLVADAIFHHEYCTYRGNILALNDADCSMIDTESFPRDSELLETCADDLIEQVEDELLWLDLKQ